MGAFADEVFEVVRQIPRGKVATYGLVARLMGRPRSARYVGFALRSNPHPGIDPDAIPCHRVVFRDGSLCKSFAFGGPDVQYRRLKEEGVPFVEDSTAAQADSDAEATFVDDEGRMHSLAALRVDLDACLWDGRPPEQEDCGDYPTEPPAGFDWSAEMGEL